ncbi:hypothetical protein [Humisphaera borealis]|uniref:Uncharacterized protein n=1 Tax=Humisphaera borealis TaxID=2807512 RepID=A0A7M2WSP8_9BACT|nr:hypothetical protein [Humisphaera borealis]QOV88304.1 hypothetical protein IPV69_18920 [Humisphaera borealis]
MRRTLIRTGLVALLAVAGGVTAGCTTKSEGERTLENADKHEQAGATIRRGELLVQEGAASEARGLAIKRQGDNTEGDRMIAEGRAKQAQGNKLIEEGRKMRP